MRMARFLLAAISIAAVGTLADCEDVQKKMVPPAQAQQQHFVTTRTAMLDAPNVRQVVRSQCMADAARRGVDEGSRGAKGRYCDSVVQRTMSGRRSYRDPAAASVTRVTPNLTSALTGSLAHRDAVACRALASADDET